MTMGIEMLKIRTGHYINPALVMDVQVVSKRVYSQGERFHLDEEDVDPSKPFTEEKSEVLVRIQMAAMVVPTDLFMTKFGIMHPLEYNLSGDEAKAFLTLIDLNYPALPPPLRRYPTLGKEKA